MDRLAETHKIPPLPSKKLFSPKYNLPVLEDYSKDAPDSYWESFPMNYKCPAKSLVNGDLLRELAIQYGYVDMEQLDKVCDWLKNGAEIGCKGKYRQPSKASNSKSAFVEGEKVSDCVADWLEKGFAFGPINLDEIPEKAKISSLLTREKPNGAVRVILNLSKPEGSSVNEGIDIGEYPAKMSSTWEWIAVLNRAGRGCLMTKIDWQEGVAPNYYKISYKMGVLHQKGINHLEFLHDKGNFIKESIVQQILTGCLQAHCCERSRHRPSIFHLAWESF